MGPDGRALTVGDGRTRLMGILNVTPDSFFDGGRYDDLARAVEQGQALVAAGALALAGRPALASASHTARAASN